MTANNIQSRLAQLSNLARRLSRQQQQYAQLQAKKNQLENLRDAWTGQVAQIAKITDQVAWAEEAKRKWTSAQLLQFKARLEDLARRWKMSLTTDSPEYQLNQLQAELEQNQAHLATLRAIEQKLRPAIELWQRWQATGQKRQLLAQVTQAQQNLAELQNSDSNLMAEFEHLDQIRAKVEVQRKARAAIADQARQLGRYLPDSQSQEWAVLALQDINQFSQKVGLGLAHQEKNIKTLQQEVKQLKQQVEARKRELKPLREKVAALEAQEGKAAATFQNEMAELAQWPKDLLELNRPEVDGQSIEELENLLAQLQAEHHHLVWFEQVIDE